MDLKNASAILILCALTACGGGTSDNGTGSVLPPGAVVPNPGTGLQFIVDANQGGNASRLEMVGQPVWGRLVDVWAPAPITNTMTLYFEDYLIGQGIDSDGVDYLLERNPVTAKQNLTILHTFQTAAFETAFARLDDGLQPFLDKSLDPSELPPFTALPRNAAMRISFNDLLNDGGNPGSPGYPGTVNAKNVQVVTGYPAINSAGARILPDPNFGDIVNGVFHSTRVLIDMSVSQAEALDQGIAPNAIGLPEAVLPALANVAVRIPTLINPSATQFSVLSNLSGKELVFAASGSTDPFSPTLDVVRAFRSGGQTVNTGDLYNGFLRDSQPPEVLGSQSVTVTFVQPSGTEFLVDMQYFSVSCATQPRPGDMLVLPGVVAEVTALGGVPAGGAVANVQVRVIGGSAAQLIPSAGNFLMPWDTTLGVAPECFVRFAPTPLQLPNMMVSNDASVLVAFSEPVFPKSANGFSGMRVGYQPAPPKSMNSHVVGVSSSNQDLTEFQFDPSARLNHVQGVSETYTFDLTSGAGGIVDLAGNPLLNPLPQTTFALNSSEATRVSGSTALQFSNAELDEDGDGLPEIRGQMIQKPGVGEITARSPLRFSAIADDSQFAVAQMSATNPVTLLPVTTRVPLSAEGARMQSVWRPADLGLPMVEVSVSTIPDPNDPTMTITVITLVGWDESAINIDVEGLSWAPSSAGLSIDNFPEFKLALGHSVYLPDETIASALTGLTTDFGGNLIPSQPTKVVHERFEGYLVQPLDLFPAPTGTLLAPWPMNRNKPLNEYEYFTWRDTSILDVGGVNSAGVDQPVFVGAALGFPGVYGGGAVPTIGLPLLMDFSVYPSNASGLNTLLGKLPLGAGAFRAYSMGHKPASGPPVTVNPDQETQATGSLFGGVPSAPIDLAFYIGQADFVVRTNQLHTVWFDAGSSTNWKPAVIDPPALEQPAGTSVAIEYRGALNVQNVAGTFIDANMYDPYGDPLDILNPGSAPFTVTYLNGDKTWHSNVADVAGARFIQVRVTMTSNVDSGVTPAISAIGLTHEN